MTNSTPPTLHPMRVVIRRTGLSPDLLRAWERRYGAVEPARSEGGQRLYSTADIERLTLLKRVTDRGRSIGQVAQLSAEELRQLLRDDEVAESVATAPRGALSAEEHAAGVREECLRAVETMDDRALEAALRRAALGLGLTGFTDHVVAPLVGEIGLRWHAGHLRPAQEHLGSATIRRVLLWAAAATVVSPEAPLLVVGTPSGHRHELGALLAVTAAAAAGWRVAYLGPDLPAEELAEAVHRTGARVLALSLVFPEGDPAAAAELGALRARLGPGIEVIAGGKAIPSYATALDTLGAIRCATLQEFRETLGTLAA